MNDETDREEVQPSPAAAAERPRGDGGIRTLLNLARGAKGAALLFFLLPWVTVSCGDRRLLEASGYGLATGNVRTLEEGAGGNQLRDAAEKASSLVSDPLVFEAANLILLALVVTFLHPRVRAAAIALAACVAAAALIAFDVLVNLERLIASQTGGSGSDGGPEGALLDQFMPRIAVAPEYGFWLTLVSLAAAAALLAAVIARSRERSGS
jgi:hypothetical protein